MPLNEPSWWYGAGALNSVAARALSPVSALYGWIADRRMARTDGVQAAVPVICVGNFTAGGTGKTPFVCWLVDMLKQRDLKPAILTRGFGGRLAGPVWVQSGAHTAVEVGDEPLLLAQHAPVLVARDRAEGVRAIAQAQTPFDLVIMDDGLQNPSVKKDLSIALVDGKRGLGNARVIPAGPLRASLSRQADRVSAVVINHSSAIGSHASFSNRIAETLHHHGFGGPVIDASVSVPDHGAPLAGQRVLAFAGIGHPERFFETVRSLRAELVVERVFADHHQITQREARALLQSAETRKLTLVTTEKDWVRLSQDDPAIAQLKAATRVVPIVMEVSQVDQDTLSALVAACCDTPT